MNERIIIKLCYFIWLNTGFFSARFCGKNVAVMPQTKAKGRKRPAGKKAKKTVKLEPKAEVVEEDVRAEEEEEETQQPKRKREKTEAG